MCKVLRDGACNQDTDCFNADLCDPVDSACEARNVCGNGVVEVGEFCDDGNTTDDDECNSICQIEFDAACTACLLYTSDAADE